MSSSRRRTRSGLLGDRDGSVALEFAFVGLIFITLLIGAVDLARYQIVRQSLRSVVEDAARSALITSSSTAVLGGGCTALPSGAALKTAITTPINPVPMLTIASLTLTPTCAVNGNNARTITVTASYAFSFVTPIYNFTGPLSATAALTY